MADVSFQQMSFLGGEWSPYAQGRMDEPSYRTAMNLCLNSFPVEEGSWVRRPGTVLASTSRNGAQASLRDFDFTQAQPYTLEFTAGHLRMFSGTSLVFELPHTVGAISTATPAVVTVPSHGYSTGNQVGFVATLLQPGISPSGSALVFNRTFSITVIDANHFSLQDPITGANIVGANINLTGFQLVVARVVDFATPYTLAEIQSNQIRVVQDEDVAVVLDGLNQPRILATTLGKFFLPLNPAAAQNAVCFKPFNFTTAAFNDGPYLDPPTDGTTLTPTGGTSPITVNASSIASINNGSGFLSTDVGRAVRLFSEPANWASGTNYTKGQNVKYSGAYWQALANNTATQPDVNPATWAITTTAAAWTWGTITTVNSTSQVVITLVASDPYGVAAGGNPLNGTQPILTWQLGVYSNTTGWPTGGAYHQGRFWLYGAQMNRVDATMSNNGGTPETTNLRFDPTSLDNTVADNNGISIVLQSTEYNTIFWLIPDHQGLLMGTQAGEWILQSSTLNDPITPFNIQAQKTTKYGCANVEPRRTGLSMTFVQRYNKRLFEYVADVYSGKFSGTNIALKAQHFTLTGIQEIAYVQERTPIVWSRMGDGSLKGMTYKRESPFSTQPASFFGWHQHTLGSGRLVESIQAGPSPGGATDALALSTNDPNTNIRFVEMMSPVLEEGAAITSANYVDAAIVPTFAEISGNSLILYGLNYIAGKTVTAWVGGVDGGDFVVSASGSVTVPINAGGILTNAYLAGLGSSDYGYLNTLVQVALGGPGFGSPFGSATSYVSAHSSASHNNQITNTMVFDWDGNALYYITGDGFISSFTITTETELSTVAAPTSLQNANSTCLGYDGNIYYTTITSSTLVNRWNVKTQTTDVVYNDTHGLASPGYSVAMRIGSAEYVLTTGLNSGTGGGSSAPWAIINMTDVGGPGLVNSGFFDEQMTSITVGNAFPIRGGASSFNCFSTNSAHVLVYGTINAGVSFQTGLYRATVDGPSSGGISKIGVISPAAILGTWTSFTIPNAYGMVYDETDGNILFTAHGSDGTARLVKVSARDASVLWSLQVSTTDQVNYRMSRIRGGRFSFVDNTSGNAVITINTLTGAVVSTNAESAAGPVDFATDDKLGMIVYNINNIGTTCFATFGPAVGGGTIPPATVYKIPAILGFNYQSQGQILRPILPQEAGTQNGPALAKTRRAQSYGMLLSGTQQLQVGTDFTHMHPVPLKTADFNTDLALNVLYSGVTWDTVDDDYSFDGMLCWGTTRPYPANVLAVGQFQHGQDR